MTEERNVLGLSAIRCNRGITLDQIADATKISVRLLTAIEQGEFQKLPGGIYDTNYIRQYAAHVAEGALYPRLRIVGVDFVFQVHAALIIHFLELFEDLRKRHHAIA